MQQALPAAIQNSELFVLYQPQMCVRDRRLVAVEALLRWERPGIGLVPPADFVPFAEDNDLIDPLGVYVLERACRDARSWRGLRVAVNVSPKQFARADLADFICGVAQAYGLRLSDLEIEVTETADFPDRDKAIAQLALMRSRGVTVSLDDLGSGHATMELMASLPLSRVKIARSMVQGCKTGKGAARLRAYAEAAQAMGCGVTAEGVETEEEYEFLRDIGCDLMQGFLFFRPVAADDILSLVAPSQRILARA